jgi:hypothetical protein
MTGAVLGDLALFLAALAAYREWQRPQSSFRNLSSAPKARAVLAGLEADESLVDPGQGLRPHLEQRELDVSLDVGIRRVDVIADVAVWIDSHIANSILDVVLQLTPAFEQDLLQVCTSSRGAHDR